MNIIYTCIYVKYIVNMVLVMEYPHKENVMKLTLNDYVDF